MWLIFLLSTTMTNGEWLKDWQPWTFMTLKCSLINVYQLNYSWWTLHERPTDEQVCNKVWVPFLLNIHYQLDREGLPNPKLAMWSIIVTCTHAMYRVYRISIKNNIFIWLVISFYFYYFIIFFINVNNNKTEITSLVFTIVRGVKFKNEWICPFKMLTYKSAKRRKNIAKDDDQSLPCLNFYIFSNDSVFLFFSFFSKMAYSFRKCSLDPGVSSKHLFAKMLSYVFWCRTSISFVCSETRSWPEHLSSSGPWPGWHARQMPGTSDDGSASPAHRSGRGWMMCEAFSSWVACGSGMDAQSSESQKTGRGPLWKKKDIRVSYTRRAPQQTWAESTTT